MSCDWHVARRQNRTEHDGHLFWPARGRPSNRLSEIEFRALVNRSRHGGHAQGHFCYVNRHDSAHHQFERPHHFAQPSHYRQANRDLQHPLARKSSQTGWGERLWVRRRQRPYDLRGREKRRAAAPPQGAGGAPRERAGSITLSAPYPRCEASRLWRGTSSRDYRYGRFFWLMQGLRCVQTNHLRWQPAFYSPSAESLERHRGSASRAASVWARVGPIGRVYQGF